MGEFFAHPIKVGRLWPVWSLETFFVDASISFSFRSRPIPFSFLFCNPTLFRGERASEKKEMVSYIVKNDDGGICLQYAEILSFGIPFHRYDFSAKCHSFFVREKRLFLLALCLLKEIPRGLLLCECRFELGDLMKRSPNVCPSGPIRHGLAQGPKLPGTRKRDSSVKRNRLNSLHHFMREEKLVNKPWIGFVRQIQSCLVVWKICWTRLRLIFPGDSARTLCKNRSTKIKVPQSGWVLHTRSKVMVVTKPH